MEQEPKRVEPETPAAEPIAAAEPAPASTFVPGNGAAEAEPEAASVWFPRRESGESLLSPPDAAPWNGAQPAAEAPAPVRAAEEEPAAAAGQRPAAGGPNLMLAIVCWVASATAFFEAYSLFTGGWLHSYAFNGYLALGVGVLLFSLEALYWARPRLRWLDYLFTPAALLTIVGVVCLVLSQAPGRRI